MGMTHITKNRPHPVPLPPETFPAEPDANALYQAAELPELGQHGGPPVVRIDGAVQVRLDNARSLTTQQMGVPDVGQRIIGTNVARKDVAIRNLGTTNVYITGEQQSATVTQGWPILPGEIFICESVHEIWACSSGPGVTGSIAIVQQLRDGG